MPRDVKPQTARKVRLEDVDRGVKSWFSRVVQSKVTSPDGNRKEVSVVFSAGERWVTSADKQGIRDRDGRLILPAIEISRPGFLMSDNMTALGVNVPTMQVSKLVSPKTAMLSELDLARPVSTRRLRDGAVYDVYTVPFPANGTMPYNVKVQAQYIQQMNEIVEKLVYNLEFFDVPSFVIELDGDHRPTGIPTGQGETELAPADHQRFDIRRPLSEHYVVGYIEGDFGDQSNLAEFTDQERIIEMQFTFKVPVALMLDPEGERPAVQRERTAFTLELGDEKCHFVDDPNMLELIFGPDKPK